VEAMTLASRIVVINQHRIEQIGTPMEIYRRPATRFVASFVGTPRINLVPVQTVAVDGMAVATLPGGAVIRTGVPSSTLPVTGSLTLGLRPEAVRITTSEGSVMGTASVVERLGDRTLVHVALPDGTLLTAEDRGDSSVQAGQPVDLRVDGFAAHFFDAGGTGYHSVSH
ncbi:MAG: TOBE domain-containing protein, partial [Steroidobacteraceae bacterium]